MHKRVPVQWVSVAMAALLLMSCGGSGGAVPLTPEELAGVRLNAADLGGDWRVTPDLEGHSGVVTEEMEGDFSSFPLCDEAGAEAATAVAEADWRALAGFTRGEQGSVYVPWMVQKLLSGDPEEIEATFNTIKSGYSACVGVEQMVEDFGLFGVELVALPPVGDDRIGLRHYYPIDQSEGSDRWDSRTILVRQGAVIMELIVGEINTGETQVSQAEIVDIVQAAADKLP